MKSCGSSLLQRRPLLREDPRLPKVIMVWDARPKVQVTIEPSGGSFACARGESLLRGMLRQGLRGIPAGCLNGGCGLCKVKILKGSLVPLGPISRAQVSEAEEAEGTTLACRVAASTDIVLRLAGRPEKGFSLGSRAQATPPAITK